MEIGIDAITAGADEPGMHAADPQHWSKRSAAPLQQTSGSAPRGSNV
jgi:hypothetical protein